MTDCLPENTELKGGPRLLVEGYVARTLVQGAQTVLQFYGPGDFVGYDGPLPKGVTVHWHTETPCVLRSNTPKNARRLALERMLYETTEDLLSRRADVATRINRSLHRFVRMFSDPQAGSWLLKVSKSRLALHAGVALEQVSRQLSRLVAEGCVKREGGSLRILRLPYPETARHAAE